ncbi:MAG TPA: WXG100 family type VII secretion target [Rugosimonospora sp.]|nr:WXG100 family type VII secretion target [Rugosimonospora sp.]
MSQPMVYNFEGINSVSGSIATFVNDMNETLNQVDTTFRNLLQDGWSGPAADAFAGCSQKWHQNADQMAQTLQQLSQKVGNAAVNMQQADQAAAARF